MGRHTERVEAGQADLLDEREVTFAEKLLSTQRRLMDSAFLSRLPPGLRSMPIPKDFSELTRCFVRVGERGVAGLAVPSLENAAGENLTLDADGTYFLPFCAVADVLEEDRVRLV